MILVSLPTCVAPKRRPSLEMHDLAKSNERATDDRSTADHALSKNPSGSGVLFKRWEARTRTAWSIQKWSGIEAQP